MSDRSGQIEPSVTFGSYVIPETIRESHVEAEHQIDPKAMMAPVAFFPEVSQSYEAYIPLKDRAARSLPIDPLLLTTGLVVVLTFLLGVLTTLYFAGPRDAQLADAPSFVGDTQNLALSDAVSSSSASLQQVVATSLEQEVTRTAGTDLINPTSAGNLSPTHEEAVEVAILQGLTPARTLGRLTEAEKAQSVAQAVAIISRNKLRMLREGVLADVYSVETLNEGGRKRIVLRTVNADLTSRSMAILLQHAAADGKIEIPAALNTADGQADMDTLIFNLVQTSLANDGTVEGAEAARQLGRRAFAASNAKTKQVAGERIYVVEPGDSLAYISLQFYGRPNAYLKIFEANRQSLRSPDRIQIGQRLIIPG